MTQQEDFIYGMRIIPRRDETGLAFGGFEGIVINSTFQGYDFIEISKNVRRDGGYYTDSFVTIPWEETLKHSTSSGKEKAEFLYSEAKKFSKGNEEIAICDNLASHIYLLDYCWNQLQEILKQRQEEEYQ